MSLDQNIENYHKTRLKELAKHILLNTKLDYDFFGPPDFESYMIQLKIVDCPIVCVNYILLELTNDNPMLLLQIYSTIIEEVNTLDREILSYINFANSNDAINSFVVDDGSLFMRSVFIDNPAKKLDVTSIIYSLKLTSNSLLIHSESLRAIANGTISCEEAIKKYDAY
ncbi:hypothetical protein OAU94_03750 [Flavobacteriaceae bacterium]|nr:hypothetical protein [Flavobacteriaceae bacterium]